jgi:hypothetical protein
MLVVASFAMFARDQLAGASQHQQTELASGVAPPTSDVAVSTHHHQPRRFIDGAASDLTAPFRSIIRSNSEWVLHIFPGICALLVYGLGIGFLARYSNGVVR